MKKILCALLLCVFISPCVWGAGQPTEKCYEWIMDGNKETSFLQVFYDHGEDSEFPTLEGGVICKNEVLKALRDKGILNDNNKLEKSLPIMIMAGESKDSKSDTISQGRMEHIEGFVGELNSGEIKVSVSKSLALGTKDAPEKCGNYSDCAKDRRVIIIFGLFDNLREIQNLVNKETGLSFDIEPWKNVFVDVTQINKIFDKYLLYSERSVWKDKDGNFNTARLLSDSIAGVVLGTAGGLITANVVKKNQIENGFEDLRCTVGGQTVADWGDEFSVGRIQ